MARGFEIPIAIVHKRRRLAKTVRRGRGFSREELKEVGLSVKEARSYGLYVDVRRSSKHQENVAALANFLEGKKGQKPKP